MTTLPQTGRDGHATATRRPRVEPNSFSQAPRGVVVGIVLTLSVGFILGLYASVVAGDIREYGGNVYVCPAGDGSDLGMCEVVGR